MYIRPIQSDDERVFVNQSIYCNTGGLFPYYSGEDPFLNLWLCYEDCDASCDLRNCKAFTYFEIKPDFIVVIYVQSMDGERSEAAISLVEEIYKDYKRDVLVDPGLFRDFTEECCYSVPFLKTI